MMCSVTASPDLDARLHLIATRLLWVSVGWVDDAIQTACALVVAGRDTPATLAVCALSPGAAISEAEPLLRDMLGEQGVPVPPESATDSERFAYLLRGFGLGVVAFSDFYGHYYGQLPAWDEQSSMQRRVTTLLDDWEHEQDEARRDALVTDMRATVRNAGG